LTKTEAACKSCYT